jgi:hypothetical protein
VYNYFPRPQYHDENSTEHRSRRRMQSNETVDVDMHARRRFAFELAQVWNLSSRDRCAVEREIERVSCNVLILINADEQGLE